VKRALPALTCAAALVASLAACGGGAENSGLPTFTGGSTTSPSATNGPAPESRASATPDGPLALTGHSTNTYGGLKLIVNLPNDMPKSSLPSMRVFSQFLQAVGRTSARNKLDPSLSKLASPDIVTFVETFIEKGSAQGTGSMVFTVDRVRANKVGFTVVNGCVDQATLVQVRADGSRYVAGAKTNPTLRMKATIIPGDRGRTVTALNMAAGSC
jgi:hypothetical protein